MLDKLKNKGWEIKSYEGADRIFQNDFKNLFPDMESALLSFKIPLMEIMSEGGGKHPVNKRFSLLFDKILDKEISFKSRMITTIPKADGKIVGEVDEAMSHKVDFFYQGEKNNLGLEIEWNSKVLAFERDIMNFRRLFFNSAIRLGVIITRGESLDSKLVSICEEFFKNRINKKDWENSINKINLELSNYKDCNGKALKFKKHTPTQIKRIDELITSGMAPHKAIAKNYFQDKWGGQTSHINSLIERIERGGFQGIPILCIGIPSGVIDLN